MIYILVTVGTTSFDALIRILDKDIDGVNFTFQIGNGEYIPHHGKYDRFISDLADQYTAFDLVISHAGAGSVYSLLDLSQTKALIVPNTERHDPHQIELSEFVRKQNYAEVKTLDQLSKEPLEFILNDIMSKKYNSYSKTDFFVTNEILDYFGFGPFNNGDN